ncbi:MAG: HAD-IA family hydrolase [bacterium]
MKNHFDAVIFDFDYTLADSSKGVVECMNFAFSRLGLPVLSADRICPTIGLSLPDAFIELVGREHSIQADEFARLFISRADEVMTDLTTIFEGVPETLNLLKKRGKTLGIVSTKFRYRIEGILCRDNLLELFDVIVGGEDVSKHKPSPEGLLKAAEELRSVASNPLYVGDSVTDAETAKRAGMPFVAVLSGKTPKSRFDGYELYAVIENLAALPDLLADREAV